MRLYNIRIPGYVAFVVLATALSAIWLVSGGPLVAASARAADPLWQEVRPSSADALKSLQKSEHAPQSYKAFQLNEAALTNILADAPLEFTEAAKASQKEITLPTPEGGFASFRFVESPIMEPRLAAKFPDFKTYRGWGIDDPTITTRFDRTTDGFHAIVLSSRDAFHIAPLSRDDKQTYMSYFSRDAGAAGRLRCGVGPGDRATARPVHETLRRSKRQSAISTNSVNGNTWRMFRLAVASTAEYTAAHGGPAGAIAAIGTTINEVNAIYLRDLAVSFNLVDNSPIVFVNPEPPGFEYTSGNVNLLVDENQRNLDQLIGEDYYDIGQVFDSNSTGAPGKGSIGVVCNDGEKGQGASNDVGWPFDFVETVAHEIGHQFGAEHTFNGDDGYASNRNDDTAYEPGIGTTLMGYGIYRTIDFFHGTSLQLMADYLNSCGCAATANNSNTPPQVFPPIPVSPFPLGNFVIPKQTPFTLTASATDAEDTNLTFSWEEIDRGSPGGVEDVDLGNNPLFRSFPPSTSPSRTFPQMSTVLGGPADQETLPTTDRDLFFIVTARDNHSPGGGFAQGNVWVGPNQLANVWVSVLTNNGPFVVTGPSAGTEVLEGRSLTVTWDPAHTMFQPINVQTVRITLSTDNGLTFPTVLSASTLNDGSFTFSPVPHANTDHARIKVEAIDNIFFNVSPAFTIIPKPTITATGSLTITQGGPTSNLSQVAVVSDELDAVGSLAVMMTTSLPTGVTVNLSNWGNTILATGTAQCNAFAATRPITLEVTNSHGLTASTPINLVVAANPPPELGNYPNATVVASQTVVVTPDRAPFDWNINLNRITASVVVPSSPTPQITLSPTLSTGIVKILTTGNAPLRTYQIEVVAYDACGATARKTFFLTVTNSPPQINATGNPVRTTQGGTSSAASSVATVSDKQDAAGALTVSVSYPLGFPSGLVVPQPTNSNGIIKATATAICTVAPGTYSVTLTLNDTSGATASVNIPVIVDKHLPPVLGTYLDSSVIVGGFLEILPNFSPSDPNNPNNPVSVTVNPGPLPGGGSVTVPIQQNGHLMTNTVATTVPGTYQVIVTVTDICGTRVSRSFKLTVRSATCIAEQGAVFVADMGNNRVQRFGGAWNIIGAGTAGSGLGQFSRPEAAVASPDGRRFYVADTGNRRIQWSQDGGGTWTVFDTNRVPQGLVLDRDGNLYVSDAQDNLVMRYAGGNPGTPIVLAGSGTTPGRVSNPNGLAIDCRMNLYVADTGNNRILMIANADSVGFPNTGTVLAGSGAGLNPAQVTAPQGVAVDNAGNLYIADTGNNRVLTIAGAPASTAATVLCAVGQALGQVRGPEGVTIAAFTGGPLGGVESIIVSDTANNRIQGRNLTAGSWMLIPPPTGGGPGAATGQFNLPSKIR